MQSPVFASLAGLLMALVVFHGQAEIGPLTWMAGFALAFTALTLLTINHLHQGAAAPLVLLGGALLGAALAWNMAAWQVRARLADRLPAACEGLTVWADILVAELPSPTDSGLKWNGEIVGFERPPHATGCERVPGRASFSWASGGFGTQKAGALPIVRVGDVWQLPVRLKRPVAPLQFDGFDVQAYWFANGIGATASIVDKLTKQRARPLRNIRGERFDLLVQSLREFLRGRMNTALLHAPNRAVLVALVLGDQREITTADWKLFSATGIGHLVSISGMHITLFAALAGWFCKLLWKRSAWLCLKVPAPKAGAVLGLVAALFYCLLAGWGIPAQRTVFMLSAIVLALLLQSRPSPVHILGFAAGVTCLLDPWAILSAGFWLSFGAVGLLMYANVGRLRFVKSRWDWLREAVWAQWTVTVGLVPLTVMLFSQLSLVSPAANAVAIPWVSFVVTPLAMLGAFSGWALPLHWADRALSGLFDLLRPMAEWSMASLPAAVPPAAVCIASVIGSLWILAPRGVPGRGLGVVLLTALWWWPVARPVEGDFTLDVLDIGQGNALAVQTAQHTLLYDTGPAMSPQADSGLRVVLPWLAQHGLRRADGLVVSHQDNDHAGGAKSVLEQATPSWLAGSLPSDHALIKLAPRYIACRRGQAWVWDAVRFEFLFPENRDFTPKAEPNDTSCVLKVTGRHGSALLVGDIGVAQEKAMLDRLGAAALQADILLVPHHGSKTSSSEIFIDAVAPRFAIFQLGYRNRYGHPKPEVWARYASRPIEKLRTDQTGALHFAADGPSGFRVTAAKEVRRRYWHTPALATGDEAIDEQ
ncbi:MAG: DNA internalization-related competence protein ComEC/Rec2 [Burkholderiaceae bacterium]